VDAIVTVRRASGVAVAVLHGDHDLSNAPTLHAELLEVLRSRPTGLVLDFSEAAFCDLACLRTLAGFGRRAAAVGVWVRVAGPSPIVRRLLEITGLCRSLPIYPDVELALRGARGRPGVPKAGRRVTTASTSDTRITASPSEIFAEPGKPHL
jgi:anti-sigma B factor antagonist